MLISSGLQPFGYPSRRSVFHACYLPYHHQNDWDRLSLLETFSLMEALSANLTAPSWLAGELPLFLLTILFGILFGPVTCDAGQPAFLGAASITPLSSLSLLKLSDGLVLPSLVVNVFAFCVTRNTLLGWLWVLPTLEGTFALSKVPRYCSPCCWPRPQYWE